jgi:hypothetical protein
MGDGERKTMQEWKRNLTGIEKRFLEEEAMKVRTYLDAGADDISDEAIEEVIHIHPCMGARGIACRIRERLKGDSYAF